MTTLAYLNRVLDLWSISRDELDQSELLWRRLPDGSWSFAVLCNDLFAPAADAEEIAEDDLDDLERAVADTRALSTDEEHWAPVLWIARKRRRLPWRFDQMDATEALKDLFRSVTDL